MNQFNPVSEAVLADLTAVVTAANISTAEAERQLRAQDMSQHEAHLSEVVVWPTSAQMVADVLHLAHKHHIPLTPWGAGSSLEGNPIPLFGGILLSLERMNQIITVHDDDFQVTVQPGHRVQGFERSAGPAWPLFCARPRRQCLHWGDAGQ